jgi:thioredoxin 2
MAVVASLDLDDRGILVVCPSCGQRNRIAFERMGSPIRCGSCKQALSAPDEPAEIHDETDFERLVSRTSIPVVVDYWAPWCGPCRMVAPELAVVAKRNPGRLIVVKVNTDALSALAQRSNIRSIPTLAVFIGGHEVARNVGVRPAAEIETFVAQAAQASHNRAG